MREITYLVWFVWINSYTYMSRYAFACSNLKNTNAHAYTCTRVYIQTRVKGVRDSWMRMRYQWTCEVGRDAVWFATTRQMPPTIRFRYFSRSRKRKKYLSFQEGISSNTPSSTPNTNSTPSGLMRFFLTIRQVFFF